MLLLISFFFHIEISGAIYGGKWIRHGSPFHALLSPHGLQHKIIDKITDNGPRTVNKGTHLFW